MNAVFSNNKDSFQSRHSTWITCYSSVRKTPLVSMLPSVTQYNQIKAYAKHTLTLKSSTSTEKYSLQRTDCASANLQTKTSVSGDHAEQIRDSPATVVHIRGP